MRRTLLLVVVCSVAGACASSGSDDLPLLVLGTTTGTAVVDGLSGEVVRATMGGTATPDGSVVFDARPAGPMTVVTAYGAADRAERWRVTVEGSFEARVADAAGSALVLGPARAASAPLAEGALAPGRSSTRLAIARADGTVRTLDIPANVEPEAFAVDGSALFVVEYQPPELPDHYQVRRLDLGSGELGDVFSVDAELQRTMRGSARRQAWDPDGHRLYTLYTLDGTAGSGQDGRRPPGAAFVHVLDLEAQWAHCVDLPAGIDAATAGLALSEDGGTLFVGDAGGGGLAVIDTDELTVVDQAALEAGPGPEGPSVVAVDDDLVFLGQGRSVASVDRSTLQPRARFTTSDTIVGLQSEGELYVALPGAVEVLDRRTGDLRRRLTVRLYDATIESLGARAIPVYAGVECAC